MGFAAEQLATTQIDQEFKRPHLYLVQTGDTLGVQSVCDTEFEPEVLVKFERWLGSVALNESGEAGSKPPGVNLLERLRAAKAGSAEALNSVAMNVDTAVFEGVFKERYVGTTYMDQNSQGELMQYGQTNEEIYRNALVMRPNRHATLQKITKTEGLNRQRIEAALKAGKLQDYHFVAFSLVPNGVPEKDLGHEGDGYFLDSLSLNIQATTELASGRVKTHTGFMAGVEADANDTFEDRRRKRHDFKAVSKLYEWFDQEAPATAEDLLGEGLFIPKHLMPNGVVDVMRWLDMAADEVLGRSVERKVEDYVTLELDSKRREAGLKDVRQNVLQDLLVATDRLEDPMAAVQLMWDLVRQHATEASFTNLDIDPRAFGNLAAADIHRARHYLQHGEEQLAREHMEKAHENSIVSGCGGGAGSAGSGRQESSDGLEKIAGSDSKGSLAFKCPKGHLNIRQREQLLPQCQHHGCKAKVACK